MTATISETYDRAPSALVFMTRALWPSPGLRAGGTVPEIVLNWRGLRFDERLLRDFFHTTGLEAANGVPVICPHVIGFRLQMAALTHPAYPLPIWNALQVRNQFVMHRRIDAKGVYDLETRAVARRVVEKGVEVDLASRLMIGPDCVWESTVTYFYRGRFDGARSEPAVTAVPDLGSAAVADRFRMPDGGRMTFGRLTGDYNGIHLINAYARRFGFPSAFAHPQRVVAMCLARLPAPLTDAQSLDLWLKGPVAYGSDVTLRAVSEGEGAAFGVSVGDDPRTAISGQWRGWPANSR
jgi:hypothetical protein